MIFPLPSRQKLPKWEHVENQMKLLGQTEAASFSRKHPGQAERLRAWLAEIQHRDWDSPEDLSADFKNIDATTPPVAVFRFGQPTLVIETLVDFRNRIVLLTKVRIAAPLV